MKLIQSFDISEGMSVNSLKPSINSGPENSLDSCIMKEASVGDCIPKEKHSQNNGQKGLCLTDFDGNATKKMFEQVDLNSTLPANEVPLRKDSWNSGVLYDKSSEKENLAESNEVRFDILSDDETDSIHLKISSDEDNSILDSEINEQTNSCGKQLRNSIDEDISQYSSEHTNEDQLSGIPIYRRHSNDGSESDREILNGSFSEREESPLKSKDESEVIHTPSVESDIEDVPEDFGPIPSCSKSPEISLNTKVQNISGGMVNEVKYIPSSPTDFSSRESVSEISVSKIEVRDDRSFLDTDKGPLLTSDVEERMSENNSETDVVEDTDMGGESGERSNGKEEITVLKGNQNKKHLSSDDSNSAENIMENVEEGAIPVSDETKLDVCVDNEVNNVTIIEKPKTEENCSDENLLQEKKRDVNHEKEGEDEHFESTSAAKSDKEDIYIEEEEMENKRKNILQQLANEISGEENSSNTESKDIEILEYEPIVEEGEEISEIQLDKEVLDEERKHDALHTDDTNDKHVQSSNVCSEKEVMKGVPLFVESNDSKKSTTRTSSVSDSDIVLVNSPQSDTECLRNKKDPLVGNVLQENKNSSRFEKSEMSNKSCDEDNELSLVSETGEKVTRKTEALAESCEVQSGRKRTSNSEANLVNCSKRTKVSIPESKTDDECDVFMCDQTTDSEVKRKCEDADTKEKCDNRIKRLSSSHSDTVDAKKVRVTSGTSKDEKTNLLDNSDVKLKVVKNNESSVDLKSEGRKSEDVKLNPLPFLRNFSRAQLQKLTRNDLEELVLQKICEAITERSNCGELRELAQSLDQKLKAWQKKSQLLTKQVKDLNLVLKRYTSDLQKDGANAAPVKITRSVGLQVQMPGSSASTWVQEDGVRRKADKVQSSSVSTSSTSSVNTPVKTSASSPGTKTSASVPKVSEASETQGTSVSTPQKQTNNSPINSQSPVVKISQTRPTSVTSSATPSTNKISNKQSPTVNNRIKSSDLQVIDLTDAEERTKTVTARSPAASMLSTVSPTVVPVATTAIASSINTGTVSTLGNRSLRLVQHVSGSTTPLFTQSGTNAIAGQRVTYFVPSAAVPLQQRQVIISGSSQIRPSGMVNMTSRQNTIPTIVLKPGQVVPVSPVTASGASIIRSPTVNTSLQLATSRTQPRSGQLFHRLPAITGPVQSSQLSAAQSSTLSSAQSTGLTVSVSHPAPLPQIPLSGSTNPNWKLPPPKPDLKISKVPNRNQQGIVLSWNMTVTSEYEEIASYQLFAYQEGSAPPSTQLWKKVGDVKALPLPMACTLTQFMEGHKYHFAVRAVDIYARYGQFSAPGHILLTRN